MGSVREGAYNVRNLHGVYRCDVRVRGRVPQTCPLSKGSGPHPPERHAKLSIVITVWSDWRPDKAI